MNRRRTTHRSRGRSTRCTLLIVAALVAASCGGDDDDDDAVEDTIDTSAPSVTTAVETTAVETTSSEVSASTSEPAVLPADAEIVVHADAATCVFRDGEILAKFEEDDDETAVLESIEEIGSFERVPFPDNELTTGLELISIEGDPLAAAQALLELGVEASPNYIFAFAPGWKYAPDDVPDLVGSQVGGELSQDAVSIAVLDTGFEAVADDAPPATVNGVVVPDVLDPHATMPAEEEVRNGVAAGHGSFIVNMLGQLLPEATITPAAIGQRWDHDDHLDAPTPEGQAAIVRDDSSVTSALVALIEEGSFDYLNLSFGTYGCTQLLDSDVESIDRVDVYLMPLGLRTVLENWGGDDAQVFAASGNDGHRPNHREIFFPAGLAPSYEWLHSVASDPREIDDDLTDDDDYSNRGWWVELQARGTRVVSRLPATDWGPEDWYSWSGTSFAAPCALAFAAANSVADLEAASMDGTGDFTDCEINA